MAETEAGKADASKPESLAEPKDVKAEIDQNGQAAGSGTDRPETEETSEAAKSTLLDAVEDPSGEADKDDAKARVQQLQEQQRLQQQMQQRRARQVQAESQADSEQHFTPPAFPPAPVGKDDFPSANPVLGHFQGAMQAFPDEFKVWDEFRAGFTQYMLHLSSEALQQLQHAPPEADPRGRQFAAAALGGPSSGQVCINLLNDACTRGARCIDRHPPRSQWKRLREELKRKSSEISMQAEMAASEA
ncbi:unnamed protein product [Cladocopium goreaui]|nr:unnamed protein product [Cladocopium goreaui]